MSYYIDEVNVIINGKNQEIIRVTGFGYNPNIVKNHAEGIVRKNNPNSRITSVVLTHREITNEEYKILINENPNWAIE